MRLFPSLLALAVTPLAWQSVASAQVDSTMGPQGQPVVTAPAQVQVQVQVQPQPSGPMTPQPSVSTTARGASIPYPIQPMADATQPPVMPYTPPPVGALYVPAQAPAPTVLPSSAVLLLPQDLLLAGKGSWERRGNDLFLHHSGTPTSRRSGLIAGGIVLLSVGYTPALIMGSLMTLIEGSTATGSSLLLPVAGPFLSGFCALSRCDGDFLGASGLQTWAWTWMLLDGAAQVAGLAMIIAGARGRGGSGQTFLERVHILPYSTQNGGGVTLSGRF